MADIRMRKVCKAFKDVRVIEQVDLDIEDGEFAVFVGPSGCGKSTLLRLVAGLEDISSGEMTIGGKKVNNVPPSQRGVAMVFQSYALYPHMTIFDNMAFGLKLAKEDSGEIKNRVHWAAKILQMEHLLERLPKELSGGQRQRVAIGRAIVRAPKVFLFDEPLSNLDAALRGNTRVEIKKLHESLGATTIYVTHDQVEAMTLADRVVVLKDGLIEQVGAPLDLYDRPANQFVASFIGMPSMNMLPANALPDVSRVTGGRLPADGFLGVRPEGIRVHPGGGMGMAGRVDLVEALGSDTLIHVDVAGVNLIARQNERTRLEEGDAVGVEIDPAVLHMFNRDGRSLASV